MGGIGGAGRVALRMGVRRGVGTVIAAIAAVGLVAGEAWIPLGNETVRYEREPPVASGPVLNFQARSVLVGDGGPRWLHASIERDRFELGLGFMTYWPDQDGPARILAIGADADDANLMVGQDHLDLVVAVRRPGSNDHGEPAFRVEDALIDAQPQDLRLVIDGASVTVVLDGVTVLSERIEGSESVLGAWDPAHRVAIGDEAEGGFGWIGGVFDATVDTETGELPLIASGAVRPGVGIVTYEQPRVFDRPSDWSPLVAGLRTLLFIPLGFVLGRQLRWRSAAAAAAAIVLVLAVGKLLVPGRHPSVAEVLFGMLGSAVGIGLANWRRTRQHRHGAGDMPVSVNSP